MSHAVINLAEKLSLFSEQWSPKIIAQMNDCHFKLAKLEGDFVWHRHPDTDEAFIILEGQLRIDFRDGSITLGKGEMLVVPQGIEHKPFAEAECHVLVLVHEGTINTGNAPENDLTVGTGEWI